MGPKASQTRQSRSGGKTAGRRQDDRRRGEDRRSGVRAGNGPLAWVACTFVAQILGQRRPDLFSPRPDSRSAYGALQLVETRRPRIDRRI
jgi:hypothetical protein